MRIDSGDLRRLIEPVVEAMGYELWGYDFRSGLKRALLRVYIDKQGGITLDDCTRVSHQLSGVLDVDDPIKKPYALEISSPGLDRPLFNEAQFRRYQGEKVMVKLRWMIEGRRKFVGDLHGVSAGAITIKEGDVTYLVPLNAIERARLVPKV